jgi:hypothetical protein
MLTLSEDVGRWLLANIEQLRLAYQLLREENNNSALPLSGSIPPVGPDAPRQPEPDTRRAS